MSQRTPNKRNWRGRKLVDIVLKPKKIDFRSLSSSDDETQRQHKEAMYRLNENPDPFFKALNMSTATTASAGLSVSPNPEKPEIQKERSVHSPSSSSKVQEESQIYLNDNEKYISPEDLAFDKSTVHSSSSFSKVQEESEIYLKGNDNNEQYISPEDLAFGKSHENYHFELPDIPNENNEPDPGHSRYKLRNRNVSLKQIAVSYGSDSNKSTVSSEDDFSATDGSDYVPSPPPRISRGSADCDLNNDNNCPESPSILQEFSETSHENNSESLEGLNNHREVSNALDDNLAGADRAIFGVRRPSRGRKRKCPQSREERKKARYGNKEYYDYRYRLKTPKEFINFECKCKKSCHAVVPLNIRQRFFDKFWILGSYNAQTSFIGAFVSESEISKPSKKKKFNRKYKVEGYEVCRDMFCQTLKICSTRVSTAMEKLHSRKPLPDQRGVKQCGKNRISDNQIQEIRNFIESIPLYTSHYGRERTTAKFFKPGVTLSLVYDQYKQKIGTNSVSFGCFKKFFYENYNIKIKVLSKDTCNVCDTLRMEIINANRRGESTDSLEAKKKLHLDRAEKARSKMKEDIQSAKQQEDIECLTFDMEKTLPLPRLQTNIMFYKRQLWLYNLSVYSAKKHQSYCYTWVEGQAGRGAQEVGSCLIKHILNHVTAEVKHLIFWSDSCGGQNRNIKITLLMKALLQMKPTLETITFKYLVPGHSFLPNDKDFRDIERALRFNQRIYSPREYIDIMRICKKSRPLIVTEMTSQDFHSTEVLEKKIINRKITTSKKKINWLQTRQVKVCNAKNDIFKIYMKSDLNTDDYDCVDISRKNTRTCTATRSRGGNTIENNNSDDDLFRDSLIRLWPHGKPIAEPKLNDIKSIMHLIPEDCRPFYNNLIGSSEEEDDVDGFSTNLDFDVENDDSISETD